MGLEKIRKMNENTDETVFNTIFRKEKNPMRKMMRNAAVLLSLALIILMTACGAGGTEGPKSYKWGDTEFTVKEITDDEAVIGERKNSMEGKGIAVKLDFGEGVIPQGTFERNVSDGKLLLAGKKPKNYDYHMSNMVLTGNGFEAQLTGETTVYFDMDKDYKINEEDLVIKE